MILSTTQRALLAAIIKDYDRAVEFERRQWGAIHAARLAKKGIDPAILMADCGARATTIHALGDAGAITWTSAVRDGATVLRKGSWGYRIGGTRTLQYTQFLVVPTDAGRAALKVK